MKLIVLYGAPAAGKLTIARELEKITDIKVFDNHQVIDIFEPLVSREYHDFTPAVRRATLTMLEDMVKAKQSDIVTTVAYAHDFPGDETYVLDIVSLARKNGVEAFPIFLKCDREALLERVEGPTRKAFGKLTDKDAMTTAIEQYDLFTPADVEGNEVFDVTDMSAEAVAAEIKKLAKL